MRLRRVAALGLAPLACAALALPADAAAATIKLKPGPTSLGEAILLAEPGDVIELPPGRFLLTEGETLADKDLTLRGAGEGRTTVVPSGGGEALEDPGVTVVGLTVAEPRRPPQGAAEEARADEGGKGGIGRRAQIIALLATSAIFLLVLELVRRRMLVERYALLWMAAGLALLVLAIWTDLLEQIADFMGIQEPANAIFILAFGVVFLLLLNFSVVSSRLGEQSKILAQEVARLQLELEQERGAREREEGLRAQGSEHRPPVGP